MSDPGSSGVRSDADLVAAHRAGDPDAFGSLFRRHRDRLWAVALRTTGNPEDAADALQDAMISAFTRVEGYRGEAAVTTWLHRIVVNASLDRLRRNKVRRAEPLPDDLEGVTLATDALPGTGVDPGAGPEAHALADDSRRTLLAALDRISPDQKIALVLVDMEGYPVDEVARILQCPPGTVKSRCARGRARLAVELRGTGLLPDASEERSPDVSAAPGPGTTGSGRPGPRSQPAEGGAPA